ncbi:C-type lectin domain family 10 member A-like [Anarrhichthys ocellatus]|uniref:C-type lectin domain family 10 member A-like n=1 Tax=Anarrhichthys ocellatus TaxID=433405 RepID=UPI0012ECF1A3|nr:C-type lectin domain family 10 member A-like [Anarrhichthys ocellatus]
MNKSDAETPQLSRAAKMASNIYEDPSLTMNVKFCKGAGEDGGQRVERLVDIYDSVDTFTGGRVLTPEKGANTQKHPPDVQRNLLRAAALVLGFLCVLLGVAVIVLSQRHVSITPENNELKELENKYDNLSKLYHELQETVNQTQGNTTVNAGWKRFQCSYYYKSTEMKNWTESRRDCWNRGADLVVISSRDEQSFVSKLTKPDASWIGLQPVSGQSVGWGWVDGSISSYLPWKTGVNVKPDDGSRSRAFVGPEGTWQQTNNGSKRWICEKQSHRESIKSNM